MRAKDPYKPAPKQSQIPKPLCERAAWYLNSIGKDLRDNSAKRKFHDVYTAYVRLNIPVMCLDDKGDRAHEERSARVRSATCACYPPLSGLAGKGKRRKGGKRQ